jgi:ectoine hydroxylase
MTPEKILSYEPKILTQEQRQSYFDTGYIMVEKLISQEWLDRLWDVTNQFIDESRDWKASDGKFDLEPNHTKETPRLRRLTQPVQHHDVYWEFASEGPIVDLCEDLLGPDVKFHHSKLNFKYGDGGEEVQWHQDIQFYPHTNYNVLAIGLFLSDIDDEMGPLGMIPGSHNGELFNQYNDKDQWVGAIGDRDIGRVAMDKVEYLKGVAGTVTVHNARTVHGSLPNNSNRMRPLLLNAYSSADALTVTPNPSPSRYNGTVVRGKPARWVEFDPRPCQIPPDWSGGYTSIFALQQEEDAAD